MYHAEAAKRELVRRCLLPGVSLAGDRAGAWPERQPAAQVGSAANRKAGTRPCEAPPHAGGQSARRLRRQPVTSEGPGSRRQPRCPTWQLGAAGAQWWHDPESADVIDGRSHCRTAVDCLAGRA